MLKTVRVSPLGKTWILDLDGTILKHNGYKLEGHDTFLPGAREFLKGIPQQDMIIFVTSRPREAAIQTAQFLKANGVRYHTIVDSAPFGERILINDRKPSGLQMAFAVNPERDKFMDTVFEVDERL